MRVGGLVLALTALLALLGCSGEDEAAAPATTAPPAAEGPATSTVTVVAPQPPSTSTSTAEEAAPPPPGETADPAVIADAAALTAAQGSARVATTVVLREADGTEERFSGDGSFDFDRSAGEMTLTLNGVEGAPYAQAKAVFTPSGAYYRLPEGALPGGQRWLLLELRNLADLSGVDLGPIVRGSQADPSQYLLWLKALGPDVTSLGEERVRGVPTTRYRALVDLGLLEAQAPPGQDGWSEYVQTLRDRLGASAVPVEIWVDGSGLVRRLRHEYAYAAEGTATTSTTELFDFGAPVRAKVPPRGQVTVLDDLIRP